nr:MAG TPA: hypothetical protein [Caudoviricetes sp.]
MYYIKVELISVLSLKFIVKRSVFEIEIFKILFLLFC